MKKIKYAIFSICLILFVSTFLGCNNKIRSSKKIENGYGVNVHFRGNQKDIALIDSAGFKYVRMDLFWSIIESHKNYYDFRETGYDDLTNSLVKRHIIPYYVLDYSNQLYNNDKSIDTKEGRIAFCNFVDAASKRYKDKGIIWEIWNEPNKNFTSTQPNYISYSLLVKNAAKIIKRNDPSGKIVAPALAGTDNKSLGWLDQLFRHDALRDIDAISVHPYRAGRPETVSQDYAKLRDLTTHYLKKRIPIISGEWGYPTAGIYTDQEQSKYAVRMFLINQYNKVPISIWYDWKNDGNDPNNKEHNFGLRKGDVNTPKLSYFSTQTLIKFLKDYKYSRRIKIKSNNDYVLEFKNNNGDKRLACWTTDSSHKIKFPKRIKGKILSMYGESIGKINGKVIPITSMPIYILNE
ncbi:MAG: glycoside hydrolase family 5 protein [Sporolactobacillus sp.]|jgi:hypothetical protein|nr:glycoside hydrolase family 5 protein [Sporolactobacillus sp.]